MKEVNIPVVEIKNNDALDLVDLLKEMVKEEGLKKILVLTYSESESRIGWHSSGLNYMEKFGLIKEAGAVLEENFRGEI